MIEVVLTFRGVAVKTPSFFVAVFGKDLGHCLQPAP